MSNDNINLVGGIDPAKPGEDRTVEQVVGLDGPHKPGEVTHVIIPHDNIVLAQCAFCPKPATGAVEVKDPAKPEAQTFIKACNTHKEKAMRKAASVLRRYYKKRVVIDHKVRPAPDAGDKMMRPGEDGVVSK